MLPLFHAAEHLPYAKSAHLYSQNMIELESKISPDEFNGQWTDMIIDQCLMRSIKVIGGLTHGRGVSEHILTKRMLETPYCVKIQEAFEEFCGGNVEYSEQHLELRDSRRKPTSYARSQVLNNSHSKNFFVLCVQNQLRNILQLQKI